MIILFCGIPGSGKTTIAELLARRLERLGRVRLLTSDRLRPPVYRKIFRALARAEERPDFFVVDATFYKKEWRESVESLAGEDQVLTVFLDCPLQTALERNRNRQPRISERAIHIIFHKMQRPENPTLTIDSTRVSPPEAAEMIFREVRKRMK